MESTQEASQTILALLSAFGSTSIKESISIFFILMTRATGTDHSSRNVHSICVASSGSGSGSACGSVIFGYVPATASLEAACRVEAKSQALRNFAKRGSLRRHIYTSQIRTLASNAFIHSSWIVNSSEHLAFTWLRRTVSIVVVPRACVSWGHYSRYRKYQCSSIAAML